MDLTQLNVALMLKLKIYLTHLGLPYDFMQLV